MLLVTLVSVFQLSMPSWTRADDDWFSLWDSPYENFQQFPGADDSREDTSIGHLNNYFRNPYSGSHYNTHWQVPQHSSPDLYLTNQYSQLAGQYFNPLFGREIGILEDSNDNGDGIDWEKYFNLQNLHNHFDSNQNKDNRQGEFYLPHLKVNFDSRDVDGDVWSLLGKGFDGADSSEEMFWGGKSGGVELSSGPSYGHGRGSSSGGASAGELGRGGGHGLGSDETPSGYIRPWWLDSSSASSSKTTPYPAATTGAKNRRTAERARWTRQNTASTEKTTLDRLVTVIQRTVPTRQTGSATSSTPKPATPAPVTIRKQTTSTITTQQPTTTTAATKIPRTTTTAKKATTTATKKKHTTTTRKPTATKTTTESRTTALTRIPKSTKRTPKWPTITSKKPTTPSTRTTSKATTKKPLINITTEKPTTSSTRTTSTTTTKKPLINITTEKPTTSSTRTTSTTTTKKPLINVTTEKPTTATTTTTKPTSAATTRKRLTTVTTTRQTTTSTITTTLQTSTTAKPDVPEICLGSDVIDGVGYKRHWSDCDKFTQCLLSPDGSTAVYLRTCTNGTLWDQGIHSCVPADLVDCPYDRCKIPGLERYPSATNCRRYWICQEGKTKSECCPPGYSYDNTRGCIPDSHCLEDCDKGSITKNVCDRRAVPNKPLMFEQYDERQGWSLVSCVPGTVYSQIACHCLGQDGATSPQIDCRPELYIPFDGNIKDESGNNNYLQVDGVKVVDGTGYFNGKSLIRVPRFSNLDFGNTVIIKLRYREDGGGKVGAQGTAQALVANGDCNSPSSLYLATGQGQLDVGVRTLNGNNASVSLPSNDVGWKEAVLMVDKHILVGSLNGISHQTLFTGSIEPSKCALQIGRGTEFAHFHGYMDDITVYLCKPKGF